MTTIERLVNLCNPEGDINEILRVVSFRNQVLSKYLPQKVMQTNTSPQNYCQVLTKETTIPLEYQAYHSGPANQNFLVNSPGLQFVGHRKDSHVYFCLDLKETIQDYLALNVRHMVYVTDVRQLKGARIQTSYKSGTLWEDKLMAMIGSFNDLEFLQLLLEERLSDSRYLEPFRHQSKEKLREAIVSEICSWITKYTIPFRLKHLDRYKRKRQRFMLVPEPIQVNFLIEAKNNLR